jgi:hypothetical protein
MEIHIKNHLGIKDLSCNFIDCKFKTCNIRILNQHKKIHDGIKKFKCNFDNCNYCTLYSTVLRRHQKIHLGIKDHKCNYPNCKFTAREKYCLIQHQNIHLSIKNFKCDFKDCNFTTGKSYSLKRHKMKHTGDYLCYCKECGWPFREKNSLEYHVKHIHSGKIVIHEKKDEEIIAKLLNDNGIMFDRNVYISFCNSAIDKERAFLDFVIQREKGIILLEVDDSEAHRNNNLKHDGYKELKCESETNSYSVSCEQTRMMNTIASLRLAGETQQIAFLRYNPNSFKIDGIKSDISIEERHEILLDFIETWEPQQDFEIHFQCYDEYTIDNEFRRACIWEHKDFDPKLQECVFIV